MQDLAFGACYQWFVHVATPATDNSTAHLAITHLKNIITEDVAESVTLQVYISLY